MLEPLVVSHFRETEGLVHCLHPARGGLGRYVQFAHHRAFDFVEDRGRPAHTERTGLGDAEQCVAQGDRYECACV